MKRIIAMFLSIAVLLSLCACVKSAPETKPTEQGLTDEEISLQQQEIIKIGFSSSGEDDCIEEILTLDQLMSWENPYGIYSSYYFYNTLTQDEKYSYRALEYALVHSYRVTFIDDKLSIKEKRMKEILEYLSFDTPLLEQNLMHTIVPRRVEFYNYQASEDRTVEVLFRNSSIHVSNFKPDLWEKKMLALEEAKKVFASFNTDCTDVELAEQIYLYIAENIEYIPYNNDYGHYKGGTIPFLYDAFTQKKTHCDGFTNSMALLFAMAGFDQVEKVGYGTTSGHTWNCVKIGTVWYNCDGTATILTAPKGCSYIGPGLGFAFSDAMQTKEAEYAELYPACDKSYYLEPDAYLENCNNEAFFSTICDSIEDHQGWSLVVIDEYSHDNDPLQEVANRIRASVSSYTSLISNGKTVMLIIQETD